MARDDDDNDDVTRDDDDNYPSIVNLMTYLPRKSDLHLYHTLLLLQYKGMQSQCKGSVALWL